MPSQWVHTRQGQGTTHRYDTWDLHIYVAFTSRKTKTKVITLANHKAHRKSSESINSNYLLLTKSTGKSVQVSRNWFCVYFRLDEKVGRVF